MYAIVVATFGELQVKASEQRRTFAPEPVPDRLDFGDIVGSGVAFRPHV
jgi:hypothetical protein